jgi:hypothetical protein
VTRRSVIAPTSGRRHDRAVQPDGQYPDRYSLSSAQTPRNSEKLGVRLDYFAIVSTGQRHDAPANTQCDKSLRAIGSLEADAPADPPLRTICAYPFRSAFICVEPLLLTFAEWLRRRCQRGTRIAWSGDRPTNNTIEPKQPIRPLPCRHGRACSGHLRSNPRSADDRNSPVSVKMPYRTRKNTTRLLSSACNLVRIRNRSFQPI